MVMTRAIALAGALLLGASAAAAPPKIDGQALQQKFAGSADTDAFLREPGVRAELEFLLGGSIAHLDANLNVRAEVDLVGGQLRLVGNASHAGGEEEAVVCVAVAVVVAVAALGHRRGGLRLEVRLWWGARDTTPDDPDGDPPTG